MAETQSIFKIHPTAKLANFVFGLGIISLFLLFLSKYFVFLSLFLLVFSAILLLQRSFHIFSLTGQYLSEEAGIFNKKIATIPLNRVQNTQLKKAVLQRLIKIGEISIESAGEVGGKAENEIVMKNIDNPDYYYKLIVETLGRQ